MWISFLSGIIASLTPCVIVLFPLVLYKFFNKEEKQWIQFSIFIVGFLLIFSVFGIIFQQLLSSSLHNGIRLALGILFGALGILALLNRINPLNFPVIKNSFLLGGVFALMLSFSPCTIPYLGIIISIKSTGMIILEMLFFGLGLIMPAIVFAIFGKAILNITKQGKIFKKINHLMSIILIASGVYLAISITSFGKYDIWIVSAMLAIVFFILLKSFFVVNKLKDLKKAKNIFLIIALIGITIATIWHCGASIEDNHDMHVEIEENAVCNAHAQDCEVCQRCAIIFGVATVIGLLAIILSRKKIVFV